MRFFLKLVVKTRRYGALFIGTDVQRGWMLWKRKIIKLKRCHDFLFEVRHARRRTRTPITYVEEAHPSLILCSRLGSTSKGQADAKRQSGFARARPARVDLWPAKLCAPSVEID